MLKVETYKGVDISSGIVCFDIRYFVMNKLFIHFATLEEAREDIDNTIYKDLANKWVEKHQDCLKDLEFAEADLIKIGRNISRLKTA